MDDNEKRLEILRRTKKRRKQLDITVILAALAVLFLMAGIYLHQAVYYILFVACVLSAVLMIAARRKRGRAGRAVHPAPVAAQGLRLLLVKRSIAHLCRI